MNSGASPDPSHKRCGFVAVLGAPNAGKSTLVNTLVGTKVTIVADKVQTTRTTVRGIALKDNAQIVFIDTPGIFFGAQKRLERAMVAAAWQAAPEADLVMLVVDVSRKVVPDKETASILRSLKDHAKKAVLVLNKVDEVRPEKLLGISKDMNERFNFDATFMVSALKGKGTEDILRWLAQRLPEGEWMYPEDDVSDMPTRLLAAEITREKLFHKLYRELPYALTVETEEWENFANGDVKISQVIFVEREGHRKIVLGKDGDMIKHVGEAARRDLEEILETRVHLNLFVKVREDWSEDPERYAPWGLDFTS